MRRGVARIGVGINAWRHLLQPSVRKLAAVQARQVLAGTLPAGLARRYKSGSCAARQNFACGRPEFVACDSAAARHLMPISARNIGSYH